MAKQQLPRLLADENTSHRLVSACRHLVEDFPIVHLASWQGGSWLGLDDPALLISSGAEGLVLVSFDRATLAWHAGQVVRAGDDYAGLILFRRGVRTTDYGHRARLLTQFWADEGQSWDWRNRLVYLPGTP